MQLESLFEIIRLRMTHNSQTFPLMSGEYLSFKTILDSQIMHGTFSQLNEMHSNQKNTDHQLDNNTSSMHKVNLPEVKKKFLSEVMNFYVHHLINNLSTSINLRFLSSHFILNFKEKEVLAAF